MQEIAEDSTDKWEYEARIAKRFGFEQQLELPIPLPTTTSKGAANWGGPFCSSSVAHQNFRLLTTRPTVEAAPAITPGAVKAAAVIAIALNCPIRGAAAEHEIRKTPPASDFVQRFVSENFVIEFGLRVHGRHPFVC